MSDFKEQLEKMRTHRGFIAALDQSGRSTPHALRAYGITDDAWSNEEQMFAIAADVVPIVGPEVDIHCLEKAKAEERFKAAIVKELEILRSGQLVMIKITL